MRNMVDCFGRWTPRNPVGRLRLVVVLTWAPTLLGPGAVLAAEDAEQQAAVVQRQQQIDEMVQGFAPFTQALWRAELELVRRTCGSLTPDARKAIVTAGDGAVKETAKQLAVWWMKEPGGNRKSFDARQTMHEAVAAAVKPHASPDEYAAYEREHAARLARRERAARTLIITKLEQQLELSAAQRDAIAADLEKRWKAGWIRELDDQGSHLKYGYPPAPDFADECIAPHLDARQHTEWTQWTRKAGWKHLNSGGSRAFDGRSLPPDPWWQP